MTWVRMCDDSLELGIRVCERDMRDCCFLLHQSFLNHRLQRCAQNQKSRKVPWRKLLQEEEPAQETSPNILVHILQECSLCSGTQSNYWWSQPLFREVCDWVHDDFSSLCLSYSYTCLCSQLLDCSFGGTVCSCHCLWRQWIISS